jgi:hypothetical protein
MLAGFLLIFSVVLEVESEIARSQSFDDELRGTDGRVSEKRSVSPLKNSLVF